MDEADDVGVIFPVPAEYSANPIVVVLLMVVEYPQTIAVVSPTELTMVMNKAYSPTWFQYNELSPFPFSLAKAKALLTSHGWKVVPGGTSTCVDPAKCGPGIAAGKTLSFVFPYASGVAWINSMMTQLQSNAAQVGIKLNLEPKPASEVGAGGNCVVGKIPCNWDMAYYGNGWTFSPDFRPTGDTLFLCNGVADIGGYCNQANDAMMEKTLTSSNLQYMYTWQNYLATQLPEIWAPDAAAQLTEVADNLKGALPQSATLSINPENWYFVK